MLETFDCIVIGSGPGGYVAAIRAAQLGMSVAVVEKDSVGGRCLNYACIPAKAVLRVADILSEVDEAGDFGIEIASRTVRFDQVVERRKSVVNALTGGVSGLLKKNKVTYVQGEGTLTNAKTVQVGDRELVAAKGIVLATGSVKRPLPGFEFGRKVIGTEEAWALAELPSALVVVGAGASGAEIASAYARLGTQVDLYEALDRVLPTEDRDISRAVERSFKKQGITVHTGEFASPDLDADWIVIAAGRGPDAQALGLSSVGLKVSDESGLLEVDGSLRTSVEGIWAIGDLVPGPALAHKASDEGVVAVEDMAGMDTHLISYRDIPRVTFCMPNVASFGLTAEEAIEEGYDVVVGKVPYGAVGASTVYGDRGGMIKLVGETKYGELLGGHIVGAKATELIQELVTVRALEGGFQEVARTVHGHPTLSEGVMEAARAADGWLIHG